MDAYWPARVVGLLVQSIGAIIWLTRLGDRVSSTEENTKVLSERLREIDIEGTRALTVVRDRQDNVMHRLDKLEGRIPNG